MLWHSLWWERVSSIGSFGAPALRDSSMLSGGARRPLPICHWNSTLKSCGHLLTKVSDVKISSTLECLFHEVFSEINATRQVTLTANHVRTSKKQYKYNRIDGNNEPTKLQPQDMQQLVDTAERAAISCPIQRMWETQSPGAFPMFRSPPLRRAREILLSPPATSRFPPQSRQITAVAKLTPSHDWFVKASIRLDE